MVGIVTRTEALRSITWTDALRSITWTDETHLHVRITNVDLPDDVGREEVAETTRASRASTASSVFWKRTSSSSNTRNGSGGRR